MTTHVLMVRSKFLVNTDPQKRCYDGCYISSEMRYSVWEMLEMPAPEESQTARLKFWKELNDYAVSQRGEDARREFRIDAVTT